MSAANTHWDGHQWLVWDGQQWVPLPAQGPPAAPPATPPAAPAMPPAAAAPATPPTGPPTGPPPGPRRPYSPPAPIPAPAPAAAPNPYAPTPYATAPGYPTGPAPAKGSTGRTVAIIAGILVVVLVAGAGAVWLLTRPRGNGIETKSVPEILTATLDATKTQTSVHLDFRFDDTGSADVKLSRGSGGSARITDANGTRDIIATTDMVYVKADAAFWDKAIGAGAGAVVAGRWVSTPPSGADQLGTDRSLLDYDALLTELLKSDLDVTKGQVGTAEGQPALALTTSDGTLWVATTGQPLPVLVDGTAGQRVTFTDWSAPVTIQAPPADQVVSMDEVSSAAGGTDMPSDPGGTTSGSDFGDETPQVELVMEFLDAIQRGDFEYADSLCTQEFLDAGGLGPIAEGLSSYEVLSAEPAGDSVAVAVEEDWGGPPITTTYSVVVRDGQYLIYGTDNGPIGG